MVPAARRSCRVTPRLTQVILVCATIPRLMAMRGLFSYLNAYCLLWVSQRVLDDIRQKLFRHMLGAVARVL